MDASSLPARLPDVPCLVVWTQTEIDGGPPSDSLRQGLRSLVGDTMEVSVGAQGKEGKVALEDSTLDHFLSAEQSQALSLRHSERHQAALKAALDCLRRGQEWDALGGHQDLVAEEIRAALGGLAELVGETTPEEVLDALFSSFCVGK